jgi:hypothetical protein
MSKHPSIKLDHKPTLKTVTTASRNDELKVGIDYVKNTLYLHPKVQKRLRALAFHEEKKVHDLLIEALDKLFADRGHPPVQKLSK